MNEKKIVDLTSWRDSVLLPLRLLQLRALGSDDALMKIDSMRLMISMVTVGTVVLSFVMLGFAILALGWGAPFMPIFGVTLWVFCVVMAALIESLCAVLGWLTSFGTFGVTEAA